MRHAVVGAGAIGGLLAAALARAGVDVVVLMRPQTLADYEGHLAIESAVLGDFEVDVAAASALDREVDVVWVATKAMQLEPAMALLPPERVRAAIVIPLLNGVDHVALLRKRYPNVVAGTIRVESERVAPARIRQSSPFLRMELAGALGAIRDDERYRGCQSEALAVAGAEGAWIDTDALRTLQDTAPGEMRSSMQKDVAAGRQPELDAIARPILRGGHHHNIPVPNTDQLAQLVAARTG